MVPPENVAHVPPPVTAPDVPPLAGATNVPAPVSLIVKELGLLAAANATPPAVIVFGVVVGLRLMMSHRTRWACANTHGATAIMTSMGMPKTKALMDFVVILPPKAYFLR